MEGILKQCKEQIKLFTEEDIKNLKKIMILCLTINIMNRLEKLN